MRKKRKKTNRKNVQWMAAAALTAALLSGQIMPVTAQSSSTAVEISAIIPENITIETPVPLSEISLPGSEYGTLSWADDTQIPTRRSEAFKVIFHPSDSSGLSAADLSEMEGWNVYLDEETGEIVGYVTVVINSIQQSEEDTSYYEEVQEETMIQELPEESIPAEEIPGSENAGEEQTETVVTEEENPETASDTENPEISGEAAENTQNSENTEQADIAEPTDAAEPAENIGNNEPAAEAAAENTGNNEPAAENTAEAETGESDSQEPSLEEPEKEEVSENDPSTDVNTDTPDNIFDRADEEIVDERPVTAEETLTEEEKQQRAEENHSCDGIYVSGIHLPWYVQFRASSGESYEFTNESQANIFRSYEFELWDLKNNTEYEIPDGEYISVTIPVKEGYEYTVEHLLDNGATETIIPHVEGSIMVFSTHSFSPFGIAGSKTLVGEEVGANAYLTPTPTPAVSPTQAITPTVSPAGSDSNGNGANGGNNTGGNGANDNKNDNSNGNGSNEGDGKTGGSTTDRPGTGSTPTPTPASGKNNNSDSNTGSGAAGYSNTGSGSQTDQNTQKNADDNTKSTLDDGRKDSSVSGQNTTNKAVQTGDDTQILPFVILVIAAVIIIGAVLILKKKKK